MKLENLFDGQKALAKVAGDFLNSEEFNKMVQKEVVDGNMNFLFSF